MNSTEIISAFACALTLAVGAIIPAIVTRRKDEKALQEYIQELDAWIDSAESAEQKSARSKAKKVIVTSCKENNPDLYLEELGIDTLPPKLENLDHVTDIILHSNRISNADDLFNIPKLELINLNNNPFLRNIPTPGSKYPVLEEMRFENCAIEEIPESIEHLCDLKSLNLSHNKIQTIPDVIAQCSQLETLKIHENPISVPLPRTMLDANQLRDLQMDTRVRADARNQEILEKIHANAKAYRKLNPIVKDTTLTSRELCEKIADGDQSIISFLESNPVLTGFFTNIQKTGAWETESDKNEQVNTIKNMYSIVTKMMQDQSYKHDCLAMATEGTTSCADRSTYYYLLMTIGLQHQSIDKNSRLEDIITFTKTRAMLNATYDAAQKNIESSTTSTSEDSTQEREELEYCLAYLQNVRDILKIKMPDMFFTQQIKLDENLLEENRKHLEDNQSMENEAVNIIINDDYLKQCATIQDLSEPIDQYYGERLNHLELSQMTDEEYTKSIRRIAEDKQKHMSDYLIRAIHGESIKKLREELVDQLSADQAILHLEKKEKPKRTDYFKKLLQHSISPKKSEAKQLNKPVQLSKTPTNHSAMKKNSTTNDSNIRKLAKILAKITASNTNIQRKMR